MRVSLCLVLAACGQTAEPRPSPVHASAPASTPSSTRPVIAAARTTQPVGPPLTAAHGAEIVTLATTIDGAAVVSADRLGGIRLWPALDGTREPVVIHGTAPRSLTLARDGEDFVIGMLDAAGGVRLIRTTKTGEVRERTSVTRDQPTLQIAHTSEGLLLLRADQTIELVGSNGTVRSQLTPDPGTHVDSLVTHGDRVLALIREGRQVRGQWIVIQRGARWGKATPKLPFAPARAVLSPNGALLAVSRARHLHPTLIDVATGVARKTPLCVSEGWPRSEGHGPDVSDLLRSENAPAPVGFFSNTVVACSVITSLVWWNTDGTQTDTMVGAIGLSTAPHVVTARAVIAGAGPSLAMATPTANTFLGYGFHDVAQLHAGPRGLLIAGDQHAYALDPALRERARLELGRSGSDWSDVVVLDDRYAILTLRRHSSRGIGHQLVVFDGVTKTEHQRLPYATNSMQVAYEPATRLLATSDGARSLVVRFDADSHTFGPPIRLASAIVTSRIALVDPALTGGVAALEIDSTSDGILVGEIAEADLVPGALVQPKTTYRVAGTLRAVDRAGRLYMQVPDAPEAATDAAADAGAPAGSVDDDGNAVEVPRDIVIYTHGEAGARLPGVAALTLRPNADGSRIAAFGAPRLALFAADGTTRWDTAHWSGSDVSWTAQGELYVAFASAVGRIDLDTGALIERRCGWGFGLSDQQHEAGNGEASICDAP